MLRAPPGPLLFFFPPPLVFPLTIEVCLHTFVFHFQSPGPVLDPPADPPHLLFSFFFVATLSWDLSSRTFNQCITFVPVSYPSPLVLGSLLSWVEFSFSFFSLPSSFCLFVLLGLPPFPFKAGCEYMNRGMFFRFGIITQKGFCAVFPFPSPGLILFAFTDPHFFTVDFCRPLYMFIEGRGWTVLGDPPKFSPPDRMFKFLPIHFIPPPPKGFHIVVCFTFFF